MEPATTIIEICGGTHETARLSGRSHSRVCRWTYPKERRGTGGQVPSDVQHTLLINAVREGRDLRPEHFFNLPADVRLAIGLTVVDDSERSAA